MTSVTVRVPATTANLGPGFDCVGAALGLHNTVHAEALPRPDWQVAVRGHGEGELPTGPDNLVVVAMRRLFARCPHAPAGVRVELDNGVPLRSGLGSSAAALVGGLMAANELCDHPFSSDELAALALELERHPDNVTPALVGGLCVAVAESGRLSYVRFEPPPGLTAVVAVPGRGLSTHHSRRLLPDHYGRADTVFNVGHAALLVAALVSGRYELLQTAMRDRLHEPYRLPVIPGALETLDAAREAGALGAVLSGSGPTLLALCDGPDSAQAVTAAMLETGRRHDPAVQVLNLPLERFGARVVDGG